MLYEHFEKHLLKAPTSPCLTTVSSASSLTSLVSNSPSGSSSPTSTGAVVASCMMPVPMQYRALPPSGAANVAPLRFAAALAALARPLAAVPAPQGKRLGPAGTVDGPPSGLVSSLGTVPAGGSMQLPFTWPSAPPPGMTFNALQHPQHAQFIVLPQPRPLSTHAPLLSLPHWQPQARALLLKSQPHSALAEPDLVQTKRARFQI